MQLVISDHHEGLRNAIKRHFQGASWQHCQTHFHRNIKGITPPKYQRQVADALKDVFNAPDLNTAKKRLSSMMDTYENILPKLVDKIDRDVAHCLTCFDFPQKHRKRIRTTNLLERLNREIKRRADVVQIFPNEVACTRLIGALCMEWSEGVDRWQTLSGYDVLETKSLTPISRSYLFTELFGLDLFW